jgi:hypothetical protein
MDKAYMDEDYMDAACLVPDSITDWFHQHTTNKPVLVPSSTSSKQLAFSRQAPISTKEVLKTLPDIPIPSRRALYRAGCQTDTEWAKGACSVTNLHGATPLPLWILTACKAFQMSMANLEGLEESLEWLEEKWLAASVEVQSEFEGAVC